MPEQVSKEELNQRWRLTWIESIFEFSNLKYQKILWVDGSMEQWPDDQERRSDFYDCYADYFDGQWLNKGYSIHVKEGRVSQKEAEVAQEFHLLADAYHQIASDDPEIILKDLEWIRITKSAKKLWDYLKDTTTSPREIELMNSLDRDFG